MSSVMTAMTSVIDYGMVPFNPPAGVLGGVAVPPAAAAVAVAPVPLGDAPADKVMLTCCGGCGGYVSWMLT